MKLNEMSFRIGLSVALIVTGTETLASSIEACKVTRVINDGVFEESLKTGDSVSFSVGKTGPELSLGEAGIVYRNELGASVSVTGKLAGGKQFRNSMIIANTFSGDEIQSSVVVNLRGNSGLISEIRDGKSRRAAEFSCGTQKLAKENLIKPRSVTCEFKNSKGKVSSASVQLEEGAIADSKMSLAIDGDRITSNLFVEECGLSGCEVTLTYNGKNDEVGQTSFVVSKVKQATIDNSIDGLTTTCTAN